MKIYNKGVFYFGVFFGIINILSFINTLRHPDPDSLRQIVLLLHMLLGILFCISSIFRALSPKFADSDDTAETEEEQDFMYKAKAKLLDWVLLGIAIFVGIDTLGYQITDNTIWLISMLPLFTIFMIYWIGELFVVPYYAKQAACHKDTENKP